MIFGVQINLNIRIWHVSIVSNLQDRRIPYIWYKAVFSVSKLSAIHIGETIENRAAWVDERVSLSEFSIELS